MADRNLMMTKGDLEDYMKDLAARKNKAQGGD
jgi:hypothetical protein